MNINFSKVHAFCVDTVLFVISAYFVFKKVFNYSASLFINRIFQKEVAVVIVNVLVFFVCYSLFASVIIYIKKRFYKDDSPSLRNPHYHCLLNNNREIEKHIGELKKRTLNLVSLKDKHFYEQNLQIIHKNMSDHINFVLKDKDLKDKDLFVYFFHDELFSLDFSKIDSFSYISHFDPTIHKTHSTDIIRLDGVGCAKFAGLRAIKTGRSVVISKITKNNYDIGGEERRKTIKHYVGIPLKIGNDVVALLNIEFHNKIFFKSDREFLDFIQKELQAFIYLYEYQIHKKYFFTYLPKAEEFV